MVIPRWSLIGILLVAGFVIPAAPAEAEPCWTLNNAPTACVWAVQGAVVFVTCSDASHSDGCDTVLAAVDGASAMVPACTGTQCDIPCHSHFPIDHVICGLNYLDARQQDAHAFVDTARTGAGMLQSALLPPFGQSVLP